MLRAARGLLLFSEGWRHFPALRGHGRSDGKRGDIASYELLLRDLVGVWREVMGGAGEGLPVFIYGHSLGGQIVLNFAAAHRPGAAGLVVTSPWLRLAFAPERWKVALAWMAARVWPGFMQGTAVRPERLSRDFDFLRSMPDLELVHHRMSARMYRAFTTGAERARTEARSLTYPLLLVHGGLDGVTSAEATEEFFRELKSEDKTLAIIPDALHETHNDLCREEVFERMVAWLRRQVGSQARS